MGRWLSRLRAEEKNTKTPGCGTDKTDENSSRGFLSVLSVPHMAESEKIRPASMPTAEDLHAAFEERAAVLEYDEGLARAEAERVAEEQVRSHAEADGKAFSEQIARAREKNGSTENPIVGLAVNASNNAGFAETRVRQLGSDRDPSSGKFENNPPAAMGSTATQSSNVRPPLGSEPVAGPGITIVPLAVEVSPAEYDHHLDALIAAAGAGTTEGKLLAFKKRKGAVVYRGADRIFTRGRL